MRRSLGKGRGTMGNDLNEDSWKLRLSPPLSNTSF